VAQLRELMLEEPQRRNYSQTTVNGFPKIVARYFHRPPDQLGPEEILAYQVYLFTGRKAERAYSRAPYSSVAVLFCKTLKRAYPIEEVPYPKAPRRLPTILARVPPREKNISVLRKSG
jgi:integrase/recombinase XerD